MAMIKQKKPGNLTKQAVQPQRGGDYNTEAHTNTHHMDKKAGNAFGAVNDSAPMDYRTKTHAEGAMSEPVANVPHPSLASKSFSGSAHQVGKNAPAPKGAHSVAPYAAHQRAGVLRHSGHPGAHRVGKR